MAVDLLALVYESADLTRAADFWATLLGRDPEPYAGGVLLRGAGGQAGLAFVPGEARPPGRDRVHVHLTSASEADHRRIVSTALGLGATHLDVGQRPADPFVVLADPDGNELCVIESGNAYLAGCGPLGEIAGEGSRGLGVFWSRALGWPLVWDQDGETAVQSPAGGTKVAWGGPPVPPLPSRCRQWLALVAEDAEAGAGRLVELGATPLPAAPGPVRLSDPDGNPFTVEPY